MSHFDFTSLNEQNSSLINLCLIYSSCRNFASAAVFSLLTAKLFILTNRDQTYHVQEAKQVLRHHEVVLRETLNDLFAPRYTENALHIWRTQEDRCYI